MRPLAIQPYQLEEKLEDILATFAMDLVRSAKTVSDYVKYVRKFVAWLGANNLRFEEVDSQHIAAYQKDLLEKYADTSTYVYRTGLNRFFKWCEARKFYPNVAASVSMPKVDDVFRTDFFTADQVEAILNSCDRGTKDGRRDYAVLMFLACTGCRINELCNMLAGDMSEKYGSMVGRIKGKHRSSKSRMILIPTEVYDALQAHWMDIGGTTPESGIVAASKDGFISDRTVRRIVDRAMVRAGVEKKKLSPHSFRHYWGMRTLEETRDLNTVRIGMGHSNVKTTQKYLHLMDQEYAFERIAQINYSAVNGKEERKRFPA